MTNFYKTQQNPMEILIDFDNIPLFVHIIFDFSPTQNVSKLL